MNPRIKPPLIAAPGHQPNRPQLAASRGAIAPSGAANPVTVPATLPAKFYRLFKP
jgi:hypothetical protein